MFDKRGQMYLLGAVVIVALIIGFTTIYNYSKKGGVSKVDELGEELEIESSKVLDYNTISEEDKLENFTKFFDDYAGEGIEIYYINGTEGDITAYTYNESGDYEVIDYNNSVEGKVSIEVNGTEYGFDLQEGENFYFVISQYIKGENYVATN